MGDLLERILDRQRLQLRRQEIAALKKTAGVLGFDVLRDIRHDNRWQLFRDGEHLHDDNAHRLTKWMEENRGRTEQ